MSCAGKPFLKVAFGQRKAFLGGGQSMCPLWPPFRFPLAYPLKSLFQEYPEIATNTERSQAKE